MTAPMQRRGPRPLPLHLTLALLRAQAALASLPQTLAPNQATNQPKATTPPDAWRHWNAGWPISKPGQDSMARIATSLAAAGQPVEALREAVMQRLLRQDRALLAGIAAYRRHPWERRMPAVPVLWQEGGSRLLDYGGEGPLLLVVPSLVNRAHVLDLTPEHSMLRHLAAHGARVLLLDWGWPGTEERDFTLTDYVAGRLDRAVSAVEPLGRPVLAGYCMGGLLTLAAALRRPEALRGLALLATPWDFHAGEDGAAERAQGLAAQLPRLEPQLRDSGSLPVDAIQMLFAGLDPWSIANKFRAFARIDQASPRAALFVALEDWLNDGIPLPAPVARECLGGWYGRNDPAALRWRVAGAVVDPTALRLPSFVAVPQADRIVPPASALALAQRLPDAQIRMVAAGHIGMAAGSRARTVLWEPLLTWLAGL